MAFHGIDWKVELENAIKMGQAGKTLVDIGNHYGVSRQRIKQVFQQHGVDPATVGITIRSQRSREQKATAHFAKWGNVEQDVYDEKRVKYRAKRHNARRCGVEFSILFSEIAFPTHCPILGLELDYLAEGRQENSVSFDRIKTTQGYVAGNVQVVSWRANRIKNDGTAEEHRLIADYLDKLTETL